MQLARMCLVWLSPSSGSLKPRPSLVGSGAILTAAVSHPHPCLLQCVDNIRCNGLMMNAFEENSKVTVPQMIK